MGRHARPAEPSDPSAPPRQNPTSTLGWGAFALAVGGAGLRLADVDWVVIGLLAGLAGIVFVILWWSALGAPPHGAGSPPRRAVPPPDPTEPD